jgi:hypothetical protein
MALYDLAALLFGLDDFMLFFYLPFSARVLMLLLWSRKNRTGDP